MRGPRDELLPLLRVESVAGIPYITARRARQRVSPSQTYQMGCSRKPFSSAGPTMMGLVASSTMRRPRYSTTSKAAEA